MYRRFGKRFLDFTIAAIGLILFSPLFLLLTIILWFTNDGHPFFRQLRPGLNESVFTLIKFTTMGNQADSHGNLLPDKERVSKIGNWLRRTSLDEIPQLLNVLKGDMSLIGPRPLLVEYLPKYNAAQRQRHTVKPGITGWAQINGRNALSWERKFEYDNWYVQNLSFRLDLKILFLTASKLLSTNISTTNEHNFPEKFVG